MESLQFSSVPPCLNPLSHLSLRLNPSSLKEAHSSHLSFGVVKKRIYGVLNKDALPAVSLCASGDCVHIHSV